jgi:hypothetical protein
LEIFGLFFKFGAHLASQNGDGILAAQSALLSGEHGATESVVVVERRRAERIGYANPLRHTVGQ